MIRAAINSAGNRSIFFHRHPRNSRFSKRSFAINISCLISSNIFITTKYEFRLFLRPSLLSSLNFKFMRMYVYRYMHAPV